MFDPFLNEFRVILSANMYRLVCYTATILTTEAVGRGLTQFGVLLTLAAREGRGAESLSFPAVGIHMWVTSTV
jgi:hypothetical protein